VHACIAQCALNIALYTALFTVRAHGEYHQKIAWSRSNCHSPGKICNAVRSHCMSLKTPNQTLILTWTLLDQITLSLWARTEKSTFNFQEYPSTVFPSRCTPLTYCMWINGDTLTTLATGLPIPTLVSADVCSGGGAKPAPHPCTAYKS